ncbi:tryptophan halogenase family protein [Massilia sp. Root335]|uniref:tryptophan halogenase family protein n=1 Tax=Massilia sp. Root335 TaxID=1736517 RepID=UPI0006FC69BB|nr:tryptophan halogenase family protein [Massilia sp. Root335]KQV40205.1 tryptophan halogenase [Massilia sp. Root335]
MSKPIEHVVVVGGGSAGWLTAAILAVEHPRLTVTLVESPGVPPIGVGEGTWPSMRETLQRIGVSEAAFFRECDAAFKQGSRFDRWVDGGDADIYFHPFSLPQGYGEANLAAAWQHGHRDVPFADLVSYQPHLCHQGRAPKQPQTPEYAGVANYGYHLDAGKFGAFLQKHCTEKLRVRHVLAHVVDIISTDAGDAAGDIQALRTREAGVVEGDLFVDCTGMASLLLGRHYGVPFVSQRDVLFNDRALAVQVPYPAPDAPIASQTTSTAQSCGWIWDIGLPARRGIGYVYSSAHCADDAAEQTLRAYLSATGIEGDIPAPRKIAFDPGYRARFWERNVVAIGLSAGFIEPLEASALALVELSAAWLADDLPATRAQMDTIAARFNEAFTYRWERIIDFLKLHYVLSRRTDSAYWLDHRTARTQSQRLRELLALWRTRAPSRRDFPRIEEIFPSASWQYILYGMGFRPEFSGRASDLPEAAAQYFREAARLTARMLPLLPANRAMLDHIRQYGMPAP